MKITKELQPALVPGWAKQVGEVRSRWEWAEPSVWTDRMLETLEAGIRSGKWFSLCDKAFSLKTLRASFARVNSNGAAKA
jgi:hypothetical protein